MAERGETRFGELEASLREMRKEIGTRPKAVLVVSGHWETPEFRVSSAAEPKMEFDYYGFPDWAYRIRYDAPGSPALAVRVAEILNEGGIAASPDSVRGLDHGTFSLMKPIYPEAEMPIVQLSIHAGYDPEVHLRAGRLLGRLRDEGVLIIGSGSSFHNMRALMGGGGQADSLEFDRWLTHALVDECGEDRAALLKNWTEAPAARAAHPREDHLVPLFVAVGAAQDELGARVYHEEAFLGNAAMSSYRFGAL
ncbi:aromatic ring-cleaving dioxygenase (plasmid) [Novosphingobium pentaromativorans US6-1]|uniref:Extradiol ring-cleavage dioxygenase class III enzyme subunit B domain-containing protein n=2 Tax=Novosphingobium pentaromativorans TaxID=205844 RepID=G6EGM4_9SPHN|nr:aromatic ring-cleaving dioxygenase [Novosphingobium pentaromativorans US6-1]EHJ59571.1 hypothetical protein NSU_3454 [Novosphingobium pentaromativorans US6-1]